MNQSSRSPLARHCVATLVFLTLFLAESVEAATYSFKISSGARNLPQITSAGSHVLVDVSPSNTSANSVTFKFLSRIPQPLAGIGAISFDTGADKGLFSSMAIQVKVGADMVPVPPTPHPYLRDFAPDFKFGLAGGPRVYDPRMLNPGDMITISAVLGSGRSFTHVLNALAQGSSPNPAVARNGLRIGIIAYHLLGRRPDPTKTIMDDAGFITSTMIGQ